MDAEAAPRTRQALAMFFALGAAAFSVLPFVAGVFWGLGLQCDESCEEVSGDWRHVKGAWQWNVLPILGAAVFVAGICLVVFVRRRRALAAGVSFVVGFAAFWAMVRWTGSDWNDHLDRLGMERFLLLVGPLFSGALAVFLTERRENEEHDGG